MPPSTMTNFFVVGLLDVEHFGEQDAGVADDHPARLEDQVTSSPCRP